MASLEALSDHIIDANKCFQSTVVNRACLFFNGRSFEITSTVPFMPPWFRCTDCPILEDEDELTDEEMEELVNMPDYEDLSDLPTSTHPKKAKT